jgi:hypothetical protein
VKTPTEIPDTRQENTSNFRFRNDISGLPFSLEAWNPAFFLPPKTLGNRLGGDQPKSAAFKGALTLMARASSLRTRKLDYGHR